jgi:hypothetical protein
MYWNELYEKCQNIIISRLYPDVSVEWLTFLLHIREVSVSNIKPGLTEIRCAFPQLLQTGAGIVH